MSIHHIQKKWMDQLINYRLWHTSWHVTTIHCIFSFVYIHDFVILLSQNIDHGHVIIRVPWSNISAKKKYWFEYWTFTIHCFLEHEWYFCPLIAVAYMSIVMFVHDDYTTCLKIIKLINCITHVMIILGPCRNNAFFFWVTNFRQELLSLLFCVCAHVVHVMLHTCLLQHSFVMIIQHAWKL